MSFFFSVASAIGSKTYILRSSLDPILIEHAAQTEEGIFEEESGDQSVLFPSLINADEADYFEDDDEDDAERVPKYYGSLISWTKGDQLGAVGVLYVILALVLVNGRIMTDGEWFLKQKKEFISYCNSRFSGFEETSQVPPSTKQSQPSSDSIYSLFYYEMSEH